jgi:hypothetical protein
VGGFQNAAPGMAAGMSDLESHEIVV